MKQNVLGKTGITVSELCYGSLPIGPLQANMPVDQAARIIRYTLEQGVNFIDTAQRYGTYAHIRQALEGYDKPVVIASKSWATGYDEMSTAIDEAREKLGRDTIDIFHLHAARANLTVFEERREALRCLCDAKKQGRIRAAGISSHSAKIIRLAANTPEIDVIHPLFNMLGVGILDGSLEDMRESIQLAIANGKGIYLMKVMAGGHLADRFQEAFAFARNLPGIAAFAVGMMSQAEVDANIACLEDRQPSPEVLAQVGKGKKQTYIFDMCKGCGVCEEHCPSNAIQVVDEKAKVDHELCLLCGYCAPFCPQFAIRLINR